MRENEDEGAHVRVNIAEDANDARPIETDRLGVARCIASEIERLGGRQREDVMVRLVVVREIHRRSSNDGQHVRHERLVPLIQLDPHVIPLLECGARRRLQIHDAAPPIGRIVTTWHGNVADVRSASQVPWRLTQLDTAADCYVRRGGRHRGLRRGMERRKEDQNGQQQAKAHQNQYAI